MPNLLKKIGIWSATIITLVCVCLMSFYNASAVTDFKSLQDQAETKIIGSAMAQCIDQLYSNSYASQQAYHYNDVTDVFKNLGNTNSVKVGYAVEKLLDAGNDGKVWCNQAGSNSGLTEVFARRIGASNAMNIVCNGERPGLMKLQYYNGTEFVDNTTHCGTLPEGYGTGMGDTLYRYVLNDKAAADSYINSIYPYDWGSAASRPLETSSEKYYAYMSDFMAVCTDGSYINTANKEVDSSKYYSTSIYRFDPNTNTAESVYYKINQSLLTGTNFISGDSSCAELANNLHTLSDFVYKDTIKLDEEKLARDREKCNTDVQSLVNARKEAANKIIEKYTQSGLVNSSNAQSAIQKASDWLNRLNQFESENKDKYYTENNGSVTCLDVPSNNGSSTPVPSPTPGGSTDNTTGNTNPGESFGEIEADDADISACKKATSLGWVICPVMNLVGKAAMGLYSQLSGQWLTIDAEEIKIGSPVYDAWKEFRNYANIAFAIVFAIVVFSQVTGIGLSNYSIKKMLPTLIVVAVLVNLSFFICQLAVDVTNIVGVGIGDVLDKIGTTSMMNSQNRTPFETAGYVTAGLFSAAGVVLGGYAAAPIVVTSIGSILIAVLLAGISSLIGYFFLLILMALRKAILYIIIVVAPLAFICYALPNTKSLFDKWKKLFMNLLLVFPICQILVYGGQAMSKIMISSDENSFFFQFTAMLLQIVPIFFIPMVLRSSMSMLGNIGTKVSQMGAKVGHGLSGLAGRTQLASRATVGMNKWGANRLSGWKRMTREPKGRLGRLSQASSKARIASALTKAEELRQSDNKATNITSEGYMDNVAASADIKAKEEAADNYVSGLLTGAVTDADGNAYDMNDIRKEVAGEGVDGDLTKLYAQALAANDETKIKGLSKYLMNIKGGKGMAVIAAAMRKKGGSAFKADGTLRAHDAKERAGFNTAAKYLTSNEKWNMMTKKWDPNMTNLLADGSVDSDDKITDRGTGAWAYYNAGAAGKSTPAQMINHDDSYFDGLKNVYGSEAGAAAIAAQNDAGAELRQSLEAYHGHAQEVFDNPRVYSQAGGALRDIQNVSNASQAYYETMNRLEQEAQASSNKAQFAKLYTQVKKEMEGKYKKLEPRNTFNVPRDNNKSNNNKNGNAYDSDGNNIFE